MNSKDKVILVHGLAGSRLDMWPIARRLQRSGFATQSWCYRSIGNDSETHAQRLLNDLIAIDSQMQETKWHVVTHSMGGIIVRAAFDHVRFSNLGRVVMLAPPHGGSHVARKLAPLFGWLTPSLKQLSDAPDSFVNQLPNSFKSKEIDFGIVEATKDRVIEAEAVRLDGSQDFAQVVGHHGILTWYRQTSDFVESFLTHGFFSAAASHQEIQPTST